MSTFRLGLYLALLAVAAPGTGVADDGNGARPAWTPMIGAVRKATAKYRNVHDAEAAGYQPFLGCVSGPNGGAMGVHYINGAYVGEGQIDVTQPEALIYEPQRNGELRLVGVEYLTFAAAWAVAHPEGPPTLAGHVLGFVNTPNRYGAGAYHELHVWAWRTNPKGTFADWNPDVTCDWYKSAP